MGWDNSAPDKTPVEQVFFQSYSDRDRSFESSLGIIEKKLFSNYMVSFWGSFFYQIRVNYLHFYANRSNNYFAVVNCW
jgi:hypothetical protein